jgi:2,3-dihydroxy-p-cumate/2,3-dihydroxybenzoate 3,4-dioxygenase
MSDVLFRYKKLGYVAMTVTDLERSSAFYRDIVGLSEVGAHGATAYFRCSQDHHNITLTQGTEPGLRRLAFEMESANDVELACDQLKKLNIAYHEIPAAEAKALGHAGGIRFLTPGGIPFELFSGTQQVSQRYAPTVAQIQRLGHSVVMVLEFEKAFTFLTEHFGFRISDHIKGTEDEPVEVVFMRCHPSPYHHSFGLSRGDKNQLHHVAFMVDDIDDIGASNNRLRKAGVPIVFGPGRHLPSGSIFLYFLDPDGITVEYTLGMEEFPEHAPRSPRKLPPRLETVDTWGGAPQPGFAGVGKINER